MERWGYWLNEPIFLDRGVYNYAKRKHAVYRFCVEGLIPFVKSAGYELEFNEAEMCRTMLRLLFKLSQGKKVRPITVECDAQEEQLAHYYYRLDTDAWFSFWSKWGTIQDFDVDGYAHCLQYEMAEYIWSWLDFERSPAIQRVYQELDDEETYDEVSKGKDDPYLQETSKRDYQDRHW